MSFLNSLRSLNSLVIVIPFWIALELLACITGPSASGSLYGMPSSIMSAPFSWRAFITSIVLFKEGKPAVQYMLSAYGKKVEVLKEMAAY